MYDELTHGLRTPLTSVLGFSSTLLDRWDELPESERLAFVRIVYGEALRMAHTVEQVDRELYCRFASPQTRSTLVKEVAAFADAS